MKEMNMIQIGMLGVLGALLAIQFKGGKTEYGIYLSAAVSMLLFVCIVDRLELFVGTIEEISRYITIDRGYISTMLKMIGITYIAEFASGICKDAGYQTIAVQIESSVNLRYWQWGFRYCLLFWRRYRSSCYEREDRKMDVMDGVRSNAGGKFDFCESG